MDMDPTTFEAPYHAELIIDGEIMANHSVEHAHLVLYIRGSCPYCIKVTKHLKKEGKTIVTKDIGSHQQAAQELIQIGGKKQGPCLVINGKALYESSDILDWLKAHKHQY